MPKSEGSKRKRPRPKRVSETREAEAAYWQRARADKVPLDEVAIERPQRPLEATFAVRFDRQTVALLRRIARASGVGVTQLVRIWVTERLGAEQAVASSLPAGVEQRLRARVAAAVIDAVPRAIAAAIDEAVAVAREAGSGSRSRG